MKTHVIYIVIILALFLILIYRGGGNFEAEKNAIVKQNKVELQELKGKHKTEMVALRESLAETTAKAEQKRDALAATLEAERKDKVDKARKSDAEIQRLLRRYKAVAKKGYVEIPRENEIQAIDDILSYEDKIKILQEECAVTLAKQKQAFIPVFKESLFAKDQEIQMLKGILRMKDAQIADLRKGKKKDMLEKVFIGIGSAVAGGLVAAGALVTVEI